MKKILSSVIVSAVLTFGLVGFASAEETVTEKAGEVASDTGKVVKKGYRAAKDKTCHLVNGKMECAAQKAKHGMQNTSDEVMDKADDIKKKIN